MYVAVITVCHMYLATACFDLVDQWGPSKTEAECIARIQEMIEDTAKVWEQYKLDVRIADTKCERANVGV